jgi:hypothetical protein
MFVNSDDDELEYLWPIMFVDYDDDNESAYFSTSRLALLHPASGWPLLPGTTMSSVGDCKKEEYIESVRNK